MARNKFPEVTVKRILDTSERLFIEKGYDNTTIQDIVDHLGDLSKGAIYHHFKGKEEIMDAVSRRYYDFDYDAYLKTERTGLLKLKKLAMFSMMNTNQKELYSSAPSFMKNAKMFTEQFFGMFGEVIPMVMPYVQEGIRDGSITSKYPEEVLEAFMLLTNFWVNPTLLPTSTEKMMKKLAFMEEMMNHAGLPIIDDELKSAMLSFQKLVLEK